MNRKLASALALAVTAAAGHAFAEDITLYSTPFTSTASRAQVQAELAQFKKSGVNPWSNTYNPLRDFEGAASREQVAGEYLTSRQRVAAMTGEDSGSSFLAARRPVPAGQLLAGQPQRAE